MVKSCYWMSGTLQLRRLFGGYTLPYIHCLFVCFLREGIHTARQLANFLYFPWFPVLLLPSPCSIFKSCSECKFVFFPPLCLFCVSVCQVCKKNSQRIVCLERDVYRLYFAQCLNCVMLYLWTWSGLHSSVSSLLQPDWAPSFRLFSVGHFLQMKKDSKGSELVNTRCSALCVALRPWTPLWNAPPFCLNPACKSNSWDLQPKTRRALKLYIRCLDSPQTTF